MNQEIVSVDLGSNSFRVLKYDCKNHQIISEYNEVVGMADGLVDTGLISKEAQERVLKAILHSVEVINYDPSKAVCVTTAAMRKASNNKEVLKYFKDKTNIEFEIIKAENLPNEVIGDPIRLNQILSNLLSNALKFTKSGYIHVTIKEIDRKNNKANIEFVVKDTGMGIPKDKHDMIFESFTQASADTTRHFGGTGLGLAICKKLVELQGGKIDVDSEPGKGSVFSVTIPLQVQAVPPP